MAGAVGMQRRGDEIDDGDGDREQRNIATSSAQIGQVDLQDLV